MEFMDSLSELCPACCTIPEHVTQLQFPMIYPHNLFLLFSIFSFLTPLGNSQRQHKFNLIVVTGSPAVGEEEPVLELDQSYLRNWWCIVIAVL
jgi:hypothetical protein